MKKKLKNSFIDSLESKSKEIFADTASEAIAALIDERLERKAEQIYKLIEEELLEKIASYKITKEKNPCLKT